MLFTLNHALRSPDSLGRESESRPLTARNLALRRGDTFAEPDEKTHTSRRGSVGLFKRLGKMLNNYVTQPSKRVPPERLPTREATNAASLHELGDIEVGQSASNAASPSPQQMPRAGRSPAVQEGPAPASSQSPEDNAPQNSNHLMTHHPRESPSSIQIPAFNRALVHHNLSFQI